MTLLANTATEKNGTLGKSKLLDVERTMQAIYATSGKRLTYEGLIRDKSLTPTREANEAPCIPNTG